MKKVLAVLVATMFAASSFAALAQDKAPEKGKKKAQAGQMDKKPAKKAAAKKGAPKKAEPK